MPEINMADVTKMGNQGVEKEVMEKIQAANSVLILMRKKPSIDEMVTAIGMEIVLDEMGKRATVLYDGEIPGEIQFLSPEKSFAKNTEVLQDFVVSFKQIMADHLRYDVVGDEVKIFISPYRQKITEKDLSFSYGEAAVDLVVKLNIRKVAEFSREGIEKILNRAEVVEIATGEIEQVGKDAWVNRAASSVAEMVAGMLGKMPGVKFRREAANAFLAGIVVMTEKFMNQKTTPETMGVAQKLMQAGANPTEIMAEIEKGRGMAAAGVAAEVSADKGGVVASEANRVGAVAEAQRVAGASAILDGGEMVKNASASDGEKKVKIPEEKIEELGRIAEEMRTEKAEKEVEERLDEMTRPKVAPIEDYKAEDVLTKGVAESVEKIRNAAVYPGADLDDYVEVQPQTWQTKDYGSMMDEELKENPAAVAAGEAGGISGAGTAGASGAADVPTMDYVATAGVENAPGLGMGAIGASGGVSGGVDEVPQAEPMRKIERPEAVVQTMTEAQLKQPWEIGVASPNESASSASSAGGEMGELSPVDGLPMPGAAAGGAESVPEGNSSEGNDVGAFHIPGM